MNRTNGTPIRTPLRRRIPDKRLAQFENLIADSNGIMRDAQIVAHLVDADTLREIMPVLYRILDRGGRIKTSLIEAMDEEKRLSGGLDA